MRSDSIEIQISIVIVERKREKMRQTAGAGGRRAGARGVSLLSNRLTLFHTGVTRGECHPIDPPTYVVFCLLPYPFT